MKRIRNRRWRSWTVACVAALGFLAMAVPVAQAGVEFWIPIRNPDKVYVTAPSYLSAYVGDSVADYDAHTDLTVHAGQGPFFGTTKVKIFDQYRPDVFANGYTELRTATRTCAALRTVRSGNVTFRTVIKIRDRLGRAVCDSDDRISRVHIVLNRAYYPLRRCAAGTGPACMQGLISHEMMHGFGFLGHDCANRILRATECGFDRNNTLSGIDVSDVNSRY